jgi:hypothetical protein
VSPHRQQRAAARHAFTVHGRHALGTALTMAAAAALVAKFEEIADIAADGEWLQKLDLMCVPPAARGGAARRTLSTLKRGNVCPIALCPIATVHVASRG